MNRTFVVLAGMAAGVGLQQAVHAAPLYSDDFDADTSANYNTFITPGASGPSSDVTWAYDYNSQLGIPTAPHSTGGTTKGVRLRVDNLQSSVGTVVGAVEIATKNISSLPAQFVVSVDIWSNYIGGNTTGTGLAASGSNGSTGVTLGVGTAGTSLQYVAGNDALMVEGFGDNGGGANQAYRLYINNTHPNPTSANYWAAGTSTTSASNTDPYYNFLTAKTAPAAQTTASATQQGSTPVGVLGFAWHTFTITKDASNYIWAIDGTTITTVPIGNVTLAGNQISLGNDDTGLTGNSSANNQLFNAEIFDNLTVTAVPEPGALALIGFGCLLGLRRRR